MPEPNNTDPDKEVEIIHQRRFHRLGELPSTTTSSQCYDIADWEKIYDLPPHSSTITSFDTPRNVNVRGKLAAFENASRQATPSINLRLNSDDTRRPSSSVRPINIDDSSRSSHVIQMNQKNGQYIRQQQQRLRQQLSPIPASVDITTDSSIHQLHQQKQRKSERQLIPSNTSLIRQINHRNENYGNRIRSIIHPNRCHQYDSEMSTSKVLRPMRDHPEYDRHQHRIPVFRCDRTANPHQYQQFIEVQPATSVTTSSRRLTRVPVDFTIDQRNPQTIEIKRSSSRTPTITQW
ncbi:hypothetical protein DINM_001800 [Dirofilaria immitis]|nr:hypothetical protein [Dirofilaria immitis]